MFNQSQRFFVVAKITIFFILYFIHCHISVQFNATKIMAVEIVNTCSGFKFMKM